MHYLCSLVILTFWEEKQKVEVGYFKWVETIRNSIHWDRDMIEQKQSEYFQGVSEDKIAGGRWKRDQVYKKNVIICIFSHY